MENPDRELYKMTETFDRDFSRKICAKGKKVNEMMKKQGETHVERPDFSPGMPLDFCGEKEHFEDKPTLRTRSN